MVGIADLHDIPTIHFLWSAGPPPTSAGFHQHYTWGSGHGRECPVGTHGDAEHHPGSATTPRGSQAARVEPYLSSQFMS